MNRFRNLKRRDPELWRLVDTETRRQAETIDLIPSENIVSPAVLEALGSDLTNKYSEGYPGKRYYAGNAVVDAIERLAEERARRAFRLGQQWHVNVQPYSGSPANLAVYFALLNPGEKLMGMSLPFGGHLTHGWPVSASGKLWETVQYTLGADGRLDYTAIRKLAMKERPKLIICGATAYPRLIDFEKFSRIAREGKAYLVADIAHIAGLVAAGLHPSPFPYADVVTTTTHKTLRGPRGAVIFVNTKSAIARHHKLDIASAVDRAVFPGLQGGPHDNQTAAIAACFGEVMRPTFRRYARQVVKNARALARALARGGFELVTGGTDNHLLLLDLTNHGISGREAQDRLERAGIIVNRNTIPFDTRSPFDPSGIRIGTPAVTSRGMDERDMDLIAGLIRDTLTKTASAANIQRQVRTLTRRRSVRVR